MNDVEFDEMLREAAPPVSPPVGLAAHRDRILAEARSRRRRRLMSWSTAGVVSALLIGGGSSAMAGFGYQTPWGWMAENVFELPQEDGSRCFTGFRIDFDGQSDNPAMDAVPEDSPIVRDAREILASIDPNALDTTQKVVELKEYEAARQASGEFGRMPAHVYAAMTEADWTRDAVILLVGDLVLEGLEARGYSTEQGLPVSVFASSEPC